MKKTDEGEYDVTGDLTIHGVTKLCDLCRRRPRQPPARTHGATMRIGLSATTKINRKDFGLTWNSALETGGVLVGEDVTSPSTRNSSSSSNQL